MPRPGLRQSWNERYLITVTVTVMDYAHSGCSNIDGPGSSDTPQLYRFQHELCYISSVPCWQVAELMRKHLRPGNAGCVALLVTGCVSGVVW